MSQRSFVVTTMWAVFIFHIQTRFALSLRRLYWKSDNRLCPVKRG